MEGQQYRVLNTVVHSKYTTVDFYETHTHTHTHTHSHSHSHTLKLTLENNSFWLLQWMMVGWLEQAKTFRDPEEWNGFNVTGFVPKITRLLLLS